MPITHFTTTQNGKILYYFNFVITQLVFLCSLYGKGGGGCKNLWALDSQVQLILQLTFFAKLYFDQGLVWSSVPA